MLFTKEQKARLSTVETLMENVRGRLDHYDKMIGDLMAMTHQNLANFTKIEKMLNDSATGEVVKETLKQVEEINVKCNLMDAQRIELEQTIKEVDAVLNQIYKKG